MILTGVKPNILAGKTPLGATLSTTNFACSDLGSSPDLRTMKPEANYLSFVAGTVFKRPIVWELIMILSSSVCQRTMLHPQLVSTQLPSGGDCRQWERSPGERSSLGHANSRHLWRLRFEVGEILCCYYETRSGNSHKMSSLFDSN
jgi:hypothetical protein